MHIMRHSDMEVEMDRLESIIPRIPMSSTILRIFSLHIQQHKASFRPGQNERVLCLIYHL